MSLDSMSLSEWKPELDFQSFSDQFWTTFSVAPLRTSFLEMARSREYHGARIGGLSPRQRHEGIRSDSTSWIDFTSQDSDLEVFFQRLMLAINQDTYYGLTHFEAHFSRYREGQFYDWHTDSTGGASLRPRRMSFIAYLHERWNPDQGGELELEDGTLIEPLPGRAVLFDSEKIRHRVRTAHFDRWSLTAWFRTGAPNGEALPG